MKYRELTDILFFPLVTKRNINIPKRPPNDQQIKMPYLLKHIEVRLVDFGTLHEPHLYDITSGQRNTASLLFNVKAGPTFHTLRIA